MTLTVKQCALLAFKVTYTGFQCEIKRIHTHSGMGAITCSKVISSKCFAYQFHVNTQYISAMYCPQTVGYTFDCSCLDVKLFHNYIYNRLMIKQIIFSAWTSWLSCPIFYKQHAQEHFHMVSRLLHTN